MSDFSLQLGKLIGATDEINKSISVLHKKADQTAINHAKLGAQIDELHSIIEDLKADLKPTIENAADYAENKKKLKYGAAGVLGAGVIGGSALPGLMNRIGEFIKWLGP